MQLIYYDSEIPQLPENLSLKKRFNYITNAIGVPDMKCSISSSALKRDSSLLVATYGSYHQTNKEKLFSLFSDFEQKKNHIYRLIYRSKEKDHFRFFSFINFKKQPENFLLQGYNSSPDQESYKSSKSKKKEKSFPSWIVKIASVAIISLLCLEFFNYYLNVSQNASPYSFLLKDEEKSVHTNLNGKSLKKPLELPFLKERAYIIDLKEKYDSQAQVIEKLQIVIKGQEEALRNMQLKTLHKHETISAKSYRPGSKIGIATSLEENFNSKE